MRLKEDASFLVGEELLQICHGLYDLQFRFYNPNTHISSGYKVEIILPNKECIEWDGSDGRRLVSFNCQAPKFTCVNLRILRNSPSKKPSGEFLKGKGMSTKYLAIDFWPIYFREGSPKP